MNAETFAFDRDHDTNDPTTGLLDRASFVTGMNIFLDQSSPEAWRSSLLRLDLDRFGDLDRRFGPEAGDRYLARIARRITTLLCGRALIARLGDDEIAVFLPGVDLGGAESVAAVLREEIRCHRFREDGVRIRLTASVGICAHDGDGARAQEMLTRAGLALDRAKALGRNRVEVWAGEDARDALGDDLAWASRIHDAIDDGRFVVWARPVVGGDEANRPAGYELVLRMVGDGDTTVDQDRVQAVAKRYGLDADLDRIVVLRAVEALVRLGRVDADAFVSFSLSARAATDDEALEQIRGLVASEGLDPSRLVVSLHDGGDEAQGRAAESFFVEAYELGLQVKFDSRPLRTGHAQPVCEVIEALAKPRRDEQRRGTSADVIEFRGDASIH